VAVKLEALRAEAEAELKEAASKVPPVRPIKDTFQEGGIIAAI
jgi:hypothetical protein